MAGIFRMRLSSWLRVSRLLDLETLWRLAGVDPPGYANPEAARIARQALLLIPITELLTRATTRPEQLSIYAKYYSHLPKQGTLQWKLSRSGDTVQPLVAGLEELRWMASAKGEELIDLYQLEIPEIDAALQGGKFRRSVAFGGSEITDLMRSRDSVSVARKKLLNNFEGSIHTRWGNVFEDAANGLVDLHFGSKTVAFGSIPGMRNEMGGTVQTYSPDGVAVVALARMHQVFELYIGRDRIATQPAYASYRAWYIERLNQYGAESDVVVLYEFKCPTKRLPDGAVPPNYALQPLLGATTIAIVELCIFVDSCFRKCKIEEFGFSPQYDYQFHASDGDALNNLPVLCGVLGVYRSGEPPVDLIAEAAELMYLADEATDITDTTDSRTDGAESAEGGKTKDAKDIQDVKDAKDIQDAKDAKDVKDIQDAKDVKDAKEGNESDEAQLDLGPITEAIIRAVAASLKHGHRTWPNDPNQRRRQVVYVAGLAYRHIQQFRAWHELGEFSRVSDGGIVEHLTYTEVIRDIQDRLRRRERRTDFSINEEAIPEVTSDELQALAQSVRLGEYLRTLDSGRQKLQAIITDVCRTILTGPEHPTFEAFLAQHVASLIDLMEPTNHDPIEGLIDYGKSSFFEMDRILADIVNAREQEQGLKVYYPSGYYLARDMHDPRYELTERHQECWIDFSIGDERRRARDWLNREARRFREFCDQQGYTPLGLLPYKLMRFWMVPMVPRNITDEIRDLVIERSRYCSEFNGRSKYEIEQELGNGRNGGYGGNAH